MWLPIPTILWPAMHQGLRDRHASCLLRYPTLRALHWLRRGLEPQLQSLDLLWYGTVPWSWCVNSEQVRKAAMGSESLRGESWSCISNGHWSNVGNRYLPSLYVVPHGRWDLPLTGGLVYPQAFSLGTFKYLRMLVGHISDSKLRGAQVKPITITWALADSNLREDSISLTHWV